MSQATRRSRVQPAPHRRPIIEAKLLEATGALLADGTPYPEISIQQLCSEAGIARSTFYVYFHDKADLVSRLAERLVGRLADNARAWWQPGSTREDARRATLEVLRAYRDNGALLGALTETAAADRELRAVQIEIVERYASPLRELVERGRLAGTGRDVAAAETVGALGWMLESTCYHHARDADDAALGRLADALTGIIWHALLPDGATEVPA